MTKITSRHQALALFKQGHYGNAVPSWTYKEFINQPLPGLFSVRYRGGIGGSGICEYLKTYKEALEITRKSSYPSKNFFYNQSCPDHRLAIQGEMRRTVQGLYLFYSMAKLPMREALKDGKHAEGLRAKMMLEHFCDPSSLNDIYWLLDKYEDASLEFTTWSCCFGTLPNRNTVVWEVRHY